MTTSRSEHALHSSSLFLIDFLLGTSRGASLFTVASPQQNRAASWRLISWSAGQAQQKMFDQPEFDYVPQFNFNYLNTQSTGRIGFKWFQNGLMTKRASETSETKQLQNLRLRTVPTCNQVIDTDLMDIWVWLLWSSCRLPTCSKSFAHWTGTGRLTRQGWASPRRPWLAQPIKHKRCQQTHERIHCLPLTQKTATERNSLKFTKFSLSLKALSQSCMNLQPGSVEAALFVAALVPP